MAKRLRHSGALPTSARQRRNKVTELVNALLGSVSEQDRILLKLKEIEGLSLKELEKVYGVNENALKVRLFRARQRVLKSYEALNAGEGRKGEDRR